eukprot:GHVH01000752.1.p1 GENE.GHVH01000752.1~~GHVH01000752.1.p1  ORF type:complete len:443 (+),score=63.60 GHVH01000752.1:666-1994(+)
MFLIITLALSSSCHFVSKDKSVTNAECATVCSETDHCVFQEPTSSGCYGHMIYGYDDEFKLEPKWTEENAFENDYHYTFIMPSESSPIDCQQSCQTSPGCGYFAFRKLGVYDDSQSPTCTLKKLSTIVKANDHLLVLSDMTCEESNPCWESNDFCDLSVSRTCNAALRECKWSGVGPLCAWESDHHISGPAYCDEDSQWISLIDTKPTYAAPEDCCDDLIWRNTLKEDNNRYNMLCSEQSKDQCLHKEVQLHCPKTCSQFIGFDNLDSQSQEQSSVHCGAGPPRKKDDCCDDSDYRFADSKCEVLTYHCHEEEVMKHCPETCQSNVTSRLPWNSVSDAHCHDYCKPSVKQQSIDETEERPSTTPSTTISTTTVEEITSAADDDTTVIIIGSAMGGLFTAGVVAAIAVVSSRRDSPPDEVSDFFQERDHETHNTHEFNSDIFA